MSNVVVGIKRKKYFMFVYDELMSIRFMKEVCPKAIPKFKAKLFGAKLVFSPDANIISTPTAKLRNIVQGVIYELSKEDIKQLDKIYSLGKYRKKVRCIIQGPYDKYYEAFMYVLLPSYQNFILPPTKYIDDIAAGYMEWNIPTTFLVKGWELTAERIGIFD